MTKPIRRVSEDNIFDALNPLRGGEKTVVRNDIRDRCWVGAVRLRDGFKCKKCGSYKDLQSHHIIPVGDESDLSYDINNGMCLCKRCHTRFHSIYGKVNIGYYEIYSFLKEAD